MPAMIQMSNGEQIPYNPVLESGFYRADEIPPEVVWGIIKASKHLAFVAARKAYPKADLVCRVLSPQDLEQTNIEWGDTTGATANEWEDHLVVNKTIDDGKFIAIYGCRNHILHMADTLPVTAFKFVVGGSEVARWELTKLFDVLTADGVTLASVVGGVYGGRLGITDAPIVVSEGISIDMDQWVATAATAFVISLEGIVVEKCGITLKP